MKDTLTLLTKIELEGTSDIYRTPMGIYIDYEDAYEQMSRLNSTSDNKMIHYSIREIPLNHDFRKECG
jgi:hypothetical protein